MPYELTGMFSGLVLDYLHTSDAIRQFYDHPVSMEGMKKAIASRASFSTDRDLLATVFTEQYQGGATDQQRKNIDLLRSRATFTVCTAHQPNIFSGYLYFVYKILHAIRICAYLKEQMPDKDFVPVYYIGSEDNDLEELGQVQVDGVKLVWRTDQRGAVGRMKVDPALLQMIAQLEGQLGVKPHGAELIAILRRCYEKGVTIAEATFRLVNELFAGYGLLVLNADDERFKRKMITVFTDDLFAHIPQRLVQEAGEKLHAHYKVQVNPREINLFYLLDNVRDRIIEDQGIYRVDNQDIRFTRKEIFDELDKHPERFSPNVVLRAMFQETILPNIAFVGGGSELAYWLEMKGLFNHYEVPFPMLVLRNSFLVAKQSQEEKLKAFGFRVEDLFQDEFHLMDQYVRSRSAQPLDVDDELKQGEQLFLALQQKAGAVDKTLLQHLEALHARFQKQLREAGKKMVRAEKKKFEVQRRQLMKLKSELFPGGKLQERTDNFMPFYADYGRDFIDMIYDQSMSLDQKFIISTIKD
jgi:bacillithiol biosynthesis cysteine-adding enzyme BshC